MTKRFPVGQDLTVDTKPRDTTVGKDVEADMRGIGTRSPEQIMRIALEARSFERGVPDGPIQIIVRPRPRHDARFDRARLGEVSLEVCGLDIDAANDPAGAEADDAPVVRLIEAGI